MVLILFAMLVIVLMAAVVVLYVAYPHRGEQVPNAPWVGDALRRGVTRLPTLGNQSVDPRPEQQPERQLR